MGRHLLEVRAAQRDATALGLGPTKHICVLIEGIGVVVASVLCLRRYGLFSYSNLFRDQIPAALSLNSITCFQAEASFSLQQDRIDELMIVHNHDELMMATLAISGDCKTLASVFFDNVVRSRHSKYYECRKSCNFW